MPAVLTGMLRPLALLGSLLVSLPLFAQWDMRAGFRAGLVQYEAEGFRVPITASAPACGADLWMRRSRFALDVGIDAFQAKPTGMFWLLSADAHLLLGRPTGPHVALGAGPSLIVTDDVTEVVVSPLASVVLPVGERQAYALVRWHQAGPELDRAKTVLILFGVRTGNLRR